MVYISSWQEFQEAAEGLYEKSPNKTRYCVKWRGAEGRLVLKITDDTTCLKFKTFSSVFLNRFEALNLSLMQKMQNRKPVQQPTPVATAGAEPAPATPDTAVLLASAVSGAASGGGVKKKKPKKKK
ncbi:hypothetical protein PHLGIDRAFT_107899 [Phlebiopsis gigantea 11061_1 CR5-6]|uniref:SRP9 domain-containing protein n=1 Tax=Phlebiopsis gigantea (strain 11061_1 CR5-6) TaxID=745531 RepID=A0A0C3PI98_PHLG1|nr:hypothetical protein PHLGIDRAFT_107899 [Phlebiopsis gigantea 11061_1 CR5-6]